MKVRTTRKVSVKDFLVLLFTGYVFVNFIIDIFVITIIVVAVVVVVVLLLLIIIIIIIIYYHCYQDIFLTNLLYTIYEIIYEMQYVTFR